MVDKQADDFINIFGDNKELFDDNQDIEIHDSVEKVDLMKFMHADEMYGIKTPIRFDDINNNDYAIYPLCTLWPDTDGTVYIGVGDDGYLISYAIDKRELITSTYDPADLSTLIKEGYNNRTIYDILFGSKLA